MNKKKNVFKIIKKGITLGITFLFVFLFSVSVCVANTYEEGYAISKVKATSLMIGTDKGFEEEKTLSRAEAITIMVRMKGISEDQVNAFKSKSDDELVFNDVPSGHWANGYVNAAYSYGITEGIGEGLFDPTREVSVAELYTMCARSLDAGLLVDSDKENAWPINYVNFANENHLSDNVNALYTDKANRKTCAVIISNTLDSFLWEKSKVTSGKKDLGNSSSIPLPEVTYTKSETKLIDRLGYKEIKNVTISEVDTKDKRIKVESPIDGKNTFEAVSSLSLLGVKRGLKCTLWIKDTNATSYQGGSDDKGKITGLYEDKDSSDVVYFEEIEEVKSATITVKDLEGKEIKLDALLTDSSPKTFNFDLYFNDIKQEDYSKLKNDLKIKGLLIKNKEGKISKMYLEEDNFFGVIKEITDKKITFESSSKIKGSTADTIMLKEENEIISQSLKGDEITLKEGDAVSFHKEKRSDLFSSSTSGDRYTITLLERLENTKIKSVSSSSKTREGIKVFQVSLEKDEETERIKKDLAIKGYTISPGDKGTFFLNSLSDIVMFKPNSESDGNFVFVTQTRKYRSKYSDEPDSYDLRVTTMDGKVSDWLELDFDESALNIAGLKTWTLTENVCTYEPELVIFTGSDLEGDDYLPLDRSYWEEHKDKKVYVLDKWVFDDSVIKDSLLGYSPWDVWDLEYNYYIFENRKDAEKVAISLLRKACEDRETDDGLYSLFNGNVFEAKINEKDKKITILGTGLDYKKEWIDPYNTSDKVPSSTISLITSFTNGKKKDYITNREDTRLYLTDTSKVFLSRWNGEFGSDQEITLKLVDKENLESIEDDYPNFIKLDDEVGISPLYAFALGVNEEELEASLLILPDKLSSFKNETELWALVLGTGSSVSDKDLTGSDNENIDSFADVIFEGTKEIRTLYFDSSKFTGLNADYASLTGFEEPRLYKFELEGNEIIRARGFKAGDTNYFDDNGEKKPGELKYSDGWLTDIVSKSRIKLSNGYVPSEIGTPSTFIKKDEDFFLNENVFILKKLEGTEDYEILDDISDLSKIELDETSPQTEQEKERINKENEELITDNTLQVITLDKEGDVEILAIIKK